MVHCVFMPLQFIQKHTRSVCFVTRDIWVIKSKFIQISSVYILHNEYLRQILSKFLHQVRRYCVMWNVLTDGQQTASRKLIAIPRPENCIRPRYDLDLRPLTLKTFPAVATHIATTYAKFRWNPLVKRYRVTQNRC